MKKYRTLKKLPGLPKGTVFEGYEKNGKKLYSPVESEGFRYPGMYYDLEEWFLEFFAEWFEEQRSV